MRPLFLIPALMLAAPAAADTISLAHTITVDGQATLYADPDHASIDLGVETSGKTVSAALAQNNIEIADILAALKGAGVAKNEVQTSTFEIAPLHPLLEKSTDQYDYSRVTGYRVTNKLTVTVSDLARTGTIIDAAANAGANSSNSVVFEIKDREALLDKVRAEAMRNAKHKADMMANAVGAEVGALITVGNLDVRSTEYESAPVSPPPPPPPPPAPGTSILPGQLAVSANVTAVFALK
jgi:uncharacterized protein YggE